MQKQRTLTPAQLRKLWARPCKRNAARLAVRIVGLRQAHALCVGWCEHLDALGGQTTLLLTHCAQSLMGWVR